MSDRRTQEESEWFTNPTDNEFNHRRYEALRAYFVDGLPANDVATRFGYTLWGFVNLVRTHRAGKLDLFTPRGKPGPTKGCAPAKDKARARIIELRREGWSIYEISARLAQEGRPLNRTGVSEILNEEGFTRLLRHPQPVASINPATPGRDTHLPTAHTARLADWPATMETRHAGLLLAVPDLIALGLPGLATTAGYPGTRGIPAASWLLSLLVLKLASVRRVSHVDDILLADPAAALLAGLNTLPKKTALTDYSYRTSRAHQAALLAGLATTLTREGLATTEDAVFDLDFHAIMHWGHDPALEKHYVPTRSQRARSVLTFFAQHHDTHTLVYANAVLAKKTQSLEALEFCDFWKHSTGHDPATLVMDQKVTTGDILARLNERGIRFITLRQRSQALMRHINTLTPADYTTTTLKRPGPHNHPHVHTDPHTTITGYPGHVRQLVVTGLGRDTPTVIITNDHTTPPARIIDTYAGRMGIEQRLAEIIRSFHTDALSSTVNLNVDLDTTLDVLAHATCSHLAQRLPGYQGKTPNTIQRRFLQTPGRITIHNNDITVHLNRRAYSPVLRQADLHDTPIPWIPGATLHYQLN